MNWSCSCFCSSPSNRFHVLFLFGVIVWISFRKLLLCRPLKVHWLCNIINRMSIFMCTINGLLNDRATSFEWHRIAFHRFFLSFLLRLILDSRLFMNFILFIIAACLGCVCYLNRQAGEMWRKLLNFQCAKRDVRHKFFKVHDVEAYVRKNVEIKYVFLKFMMPSLNWCRRAHTWRWL